MMMRIFIGFLFGAAAVLPALNAGTSAVSRVTNGEIRQLPPHFYGQNANLARGGSWRDARYTDAINRLHARHVRFPAGTLANYWDWESGWFKDGVALPYGLDEAAVNPYRLSDLKIMYDETGAMPVLVLNMLTSDLEEQLGVLREARRIGLPVRYVELGNEFYLSKPDNLEKFPSFVEYAEMANAWAKAIREEFPDVRIAAVGAAVRSWDNERRKGWNEKLFPLLRGIDAVVLHIYTGAELLKDIDTTLEAAGLVTTAKQQKIVPTDGRPGFWAVDSEQVEQLDRLYSDEGMVRMLGMSQHRWMQMDDLEFLPEGMEVWMTEYGFFDRIGPVRHTWANGLLMAAFSLQALEVPQLTMATYHSSFNHPMFAAVYGKDDVFDWLVKDQRIGEAPRSVPFSLSPSGLALSLIGRASAGMRLTAPLVFSVNPRVTDGYVQPYGQLYGAMFSSEAESRAVVLNLSGEAKRVDLSALFPGEVHVEQVSLPAPQSHGASDADYLREHFGVAAGEVLCLKPWSMTLVR